MRLFLDSSVVLAACGRAAGGSRRVFDLAPMQGWRLLTSGYVVREVEKNLAFRLPSAASHEWHRLAPLLDKVRDVTTFEWPVVFGPSKDRPILFTAAAFGDVLLTLDRNDFGPLMSTGFYGLTVLTPGGFLRRERAAGRLSA